MNNQGGGRGEIWKLWKSEIEGSAIDDGIVIVSNFIDNAFEWEKEEEREKNQEGQRRGRRGGGDGRATERRAKVGHRHRIFIDNAF